MKPRLILAVMCACAMCPILPGASGAVQEALATIPGDAIAFVCVPSVKQLDADFQGVINAMQLQMFMPPPYNSLTGMIRAFVQTGDQFDENGPLSLVLLPAESIEDLQNKVAVVVPAKEPKAMLEAMGGTAGEGGVWSVKLGGLDSFAVTGDKRVFLAPTADTAKAAAAAKPGIAGRLKPADVKAMENLDLLLWADAERLIKIVRPKINDFFAMIQAVQAASGKAATPQQVEANKKQIDKILDGSSTLTLGLSLSDAGLGFRFTMSLKPGTEMHTDSKLTKTTTDSLLKGLPGEDSMLALGLVMDPALGAKVMKEMSPLLQVPEDNKEVNKEQFNRVKGALEELAGLVAGVRCSVASLPPGPAGLIGATLIVDTTDSAKFLDLLGTLVDAGKQLPTDAVNEDVKKAVAALTHTKEAEEIGGVKVQHLKFDLAKTGDVDEDWVEQITKIIGKDGILVRMAAPDPKTIVIGFGGGTDYMNRGLTVAKANQAPLDNDPGIKKLSASLPKDRASVVYIAVDRVLACVQNGAKVLEEEMPPFHMPMINAPLAMTSTGGEGWSQADVVIPMELLVQGKNVMMGMMMSGAMGGGAPPGAQPPGGSPPPAPRKPPQE